MTADSRSLGKVEEQIYYNKISFIFTRMRMHYILDKLDFKMWCLLYKMDKKYRSLLCGTE